MAVTIKDIAKAAGVSHTTVSRALRGNPIISAETMARIQVIAQDLGYIPNTAARILKTQRSNILGVIVRRIVDPFFAEVLDGIEDVVRAEGYSLFLASSSRDSEAEKSIIHTMSEHRIDGIIICSTAAGEEHRAQLEHFNVPSVLVNNQAAAEIGYAVYNDDIFGSRLLTEHLIELGHTQIAFIGHSQAGRSSASRLEGYKEAMEAVALPINPDYLISVSNGRVQNGEEAAQKLLRLEKPPTAVVCYNDLIAIGVLTRLQKAKVAVPEDCSVVGFDNIEMAAYCNPPLTTFDQPKYELGLQAAQMLLKRIKEHHPNSQPDSKKPIKILKGKLIIRHSTAPPPN